MAIKPQRVVKIMSLGGRPSEEGGHRAIHVSLNEATRRRLEKVEKGKKSKFIENVLHDALKGMDPPDETVRAKPRSDDWLKVVEVKTAEEICKAIVARDFSEIRSVFRRIRREKPVRRTVARIIKNKPLRRALGGFT